MDTSTDRQEKRAPVTARQNTAITFCQKKTLTTAKRDFWQSGIGFYLYGVSFAHKTNSHVEARAAGTRTWHKANEGLSHTAKEKKEGVVVRGI